MTGSLAPFLQHHAALVLFACLSLGYLLGRIKIKGLQLGGASGTLLVALVIGQAEIQVAPGADDLAFSLFIFSLGYGAGPQLVASINRRDARLLTFAGLQALISVGLVVAAVHVVHLSIGAAAGLYAGGTTPASLGPLSEALERTGLSGQALVAQQTDLASVYSLTYLIKLVTVVLVGTQLLPWMMRRELAAMADQDPTGATHSSSEPHDLVGRAFHVGQPTSIQTLEARLHDAVVVASVYRSGKMLLRSDVDVVDPSDVVTLIGSRQGLLAAGRLLGPETDLPTPATAVLHSDEVMVTRRALREAGRTLRELSHGLDGAVVTGVRRGTVNLAQDPELVLQPGDVVTVVTSPALATEASARFGRRIDRSTPADFAYLGAGLAVGVLVGLVNLHLGPLDLTIGTGGGVLLAGILFGWLATKRASIGAYDPAAAAVVRDLGFGIFVAIVGLTAAPQLPALIPRYGVLLLVTVALIAVLPAMIAWLIARRVFRMSPLLTLGVIAGQQCSSASLSALRERFASTQLVTAYVTLYTMSSVIVPLVGPMMLTLISH